jgi:ATP-dependent exoDNAse (exonuclease V) beta subunit
MDCRLEHILIDEFQDTSESQFELLTRLTDGWEPSDGRTLFVVGDPMQSIYRFRKAEVALFLRARRDGFGAIPLEPLTLRVNFRSSARVVDWVNRVIGPAFPSAEDLVTGAVTYRPSTAAQPGHDTRVGMRDVLRQVASADSPAPIGPVAVHAVGPRDDEAEARIVLDIIRRERAESPLSTLAVLVRSRSHADAISTALRSAGVRFQAVDMDPLGAAAVVRDLCMLTRALRHPADRIAWLAVLRAPWCGLTLTDLATLTRDAPDATIPDLIGDRERLGRLTANGRVRVGRVRGILDSALEKKGTLPLRRWVEGVWLELGGPAGIEDENASRDAEVFLDLLDRSDRGGDIEDMKRFEVRVSRLFARPDIGAETNTRGEAFVQLLTIHKAKGLEFDTVILPGLGRTTRSDPPRLIEWMEFVDPTGRPRLLAAPVREAGAGTDPLCRFIAGAASARSFHEDTRLLYVAATRARTRLHLVGHVDPDRKSGAPRPPDSRSALSRIWQTVGHEFAAAEREPAAPAAGALVGGSLLTRVPADWSPPAESTGVFRWSDPSGDRAPAEREPGPDPARGAGHDRPTFDWAGDLQRRAGIVVHAMLERMALSWEEAVGRGPDYDGVPIRAALGAEGLAGDRLAEAVGRVRTALERTVRDPRGRWILGPHSAAESEVRLTGQIDGVVRHIVIDRTFVEDGVRWIIDYKTGTHEGGGRDRFLDNEVVRYRPQMAQYAKTVRGFDSRPIRLGLYYPMLSGWREWSFEDNVDPGNVDGTHEALAVR